MAETLTVKITENLEVQGQTVSDTITKEIGGVESVYNAKVVLTSTSATNNYIYNSAASYGVGNGDMLSSIVYIRITNLDDNYTISLNINNGESYVFLDPSESFIMFKADGAWADGSSSNAAPLSGDLNNIEANPPGAAEIYMASTGSTD